MGGAVAWSLSSRTLGSLVHSWLTLPCAHLTQLPKDPEMTVRKGVALQDAGTYRSWPGLCGSPRFPGVLAGGLQAGFRTPGVSGIWKKPGVVWQHGNSRDSGGGGRGDFKCKASLGNIVRPLSQ